ncbi:MAG: response regulator transcription factor [Bacteroidales bacterium]|nr:response regulator transcription factor [Bacteroidales bacterium]
MIQGQDKYRIMVVDDEEDICDILHFNLQNSGFYVEIATSAEEALVKLKKGFHLILLDIMMDGISGLKMVQLLREEYNNNIPVIFLSALNTESDILKGFEKGGDDYIPKPFSIKEVIARINAVLNRVYVANPPQSDAAPAIKENKLFKNGKLVIDIEEKRVFLGQTEIFLTKKEFDILNLLTSNRKKFFPREEILKLVWKNESYVLDRTVDVHIARLRKKLLENGNSIINRSGYGYCFQPTE